MDQQKIYWASLSLAVWKRFNNINHIDRKIDQSVFQIIWFVHRPVFFSFHGLQQSNPRSRNASARKPEEREAHFKNQNSLIVTRQSNGPEAPPC
jgi:hypothetical protein